MAATHAATNKNFEILPMAMLAKHYNDQKKILGDWGVTLPPEEELFQEECPLWVKVKFFDWIIREGLEA